MLVRFALFFIILTTILMLAVWVFIGNSIEVIDSYHLSRYYQEHRYIHYILRLWMIYSGINLFYIGIRKRLKDNTIRYILSRIVNIRYKVAYIISISLIYSIPWWLKAVKYKPLGILSDKVILSILDVIIIVLLVISFSYVFKDYAVKKLKEDREEKERRRREKEEKRKEKERKKMEKKQRKEREEEMKIFMKMKGD